MILCSIQDRSAICNLQSAIYDVGTAMMDYAFVTGGTGFIGQHLVRTLRERGMAVRVLTRPHADASAHASTDKIAALGAELIVGDLSDSATLRRAMRDARYVFHLAGKLLIPGVSDAVYEQTHIEGTRNLLTVCAEVGAAESIVHCSTTGVLGPTGAVLADEDAPLQPSTIYERTKAAGEQLAREMVKQQGLPIVIARPSLVYGPGDLHLLNWFRAIKRDLYRVVGNGDNMLHPIYVGDVAVGLLRCALAPAARGRVYHLVGERPTPIRELAAAMAAAMGKRLPQRRLPLPSAWAAAALIEALPGVSPERLPLTRSRVTFMSESRAYNGARASRELGFVAHVDLESGLRRTVKWYRGEGLL
jgi:dihydroflavonol-4-reductase